MLCVERLYIEIPQTQLLEFRIFLHSLPFFFGRRRISILLTLVACPGLCTVVGHCRGLRRSIRTALTAAVETTHTATPSFVILTLYFKNIYYRLDVVVLLPPLCRIGLDLLAAAPAPVVHRSIHVRVVPTRIIPVPVWQITAIGRMVATIVHNRGSMTRHALSPYCLFELPSGSFGVSRRMISRCASRLRSKTNK